MTAITAISASGWPEHRHRRHDERDREVDTNATLSYSLNAFNAWRATTSPSNGTKGRIEHTIVEQSYFNGDGGVQAAFKMAASPSPDSAARAAATTEPWTAGGHGGGDPLLLDDVFLPNPPEDRVCAPPISAPARSRFLTGIAANSMAAQAA